MNIALNIGLNSYKNRRIRATVVADVTELILRVLAYKLMCVPIVLSVIRIREHL